MHDAANYRWLDLGGQKFALYSCCKMSSLRCRERQIVYVLHLLVNHFSKWPFPIAIIQSKDMIDISELPYHYSVNCFFLFCKMIIICAWVKTAMIVCEQTLRRRSNCSNQKRIWSKRFGGGPCNFGHSYSAVVEYMTRNARWRSQRPRYKAAAHVPDFMFITIDINVRS